MRLVDVPPYELQRLVAGGVARPCLRCRIRTQLRYCLIMMGAKDRARKPALQAALEDVLLPLSVWATVGRMTMSTVRPIHMDRPYACYLLMSTFSIITFRIFIVMYWFKFFVYCSYF